MNKPGLSVAEDFDRSIENGFVRAFGILMWIYLYYISWTFDFSFSLLNLFPDIFTSTRSISIVILYISYIILAFHLYGIKGK